MLGSHNSFTYLPATSDLYNNMSALWRCQYKTLQEQYNVGVRFFDVRVALEKKAGKNMWRVAHGDVRMDKLFTSIKTIFETFKNMPGSMFRLILEDESGKNEFIADIKDFVNNPQDVCRFIGIKKNWQVLYSNMPKLIDYSYVPWNSGASFMENLKHMELSTIKKWAEQHNPVVNKPLVDDPTIHFMDWV